MSLVFEVMSLVFEVLSLVFAVMRLVFAQETQLKMCLFIEGGATQCTIVLKTNTQTEQTAYLDVSADGNLELSTQTSVAWLVTNSDGYATLKFVGGNYPNGAYLCVVEEKAVKICSKDEHLNATIEFILYGVSNTSFQIMPSKSSSILTYGAKTKQIVLSYDVGKDKGVEWTYEIANGCKPQKSANSQSLSDKPPCYDKHRSPVWNVIACLLYSTRSLQTKVEKRVSNFHRQVTHAATVDTASPHTALNATVVLESSLIEIAEMLGDKLQLYVDTTEIETKLQNSVSSFSLESDGNYIKVKTFAGEETAVVGIVYKTLHKYMKYTGIQVHRSGVKMTNRNGEVTRYAINSRLIAAGIKSNKDIGVANVQLAHLNDTSQHATETSQHTICAFWNSTGGFWSTDGCIKIRDNSNSSISTCSCDHLTNFAVLVAINGDIEIPDIHAKILNTLSMICCSISTAFLLIGITLFIIVLSSERREIRHVIHFNGMLSLFLFQIVFMGGIETESQVACRVIAIILHYGILSAFCWMLAEGICLYMAVIKVFTRLPLYFYFILGWGTPIIFVIVTATIDIDNYGQPQACWLNGHSIWFFVGPMIFIVLTNVYIIVMVTKEIINLSKAKSIGEEIKVGLRSTCILLPLLGITWSFGLLTFHSDLIVFQYIFAVLNALQGMFITIVHCFLNTEVKHMLKRKKDVWMSSRAFTRNTSSSQESKPKISHKLSIKDVQLKMSQLPSTSSPVISNRNPNCC